MLDELHFAFEVAFPRALEYFEIYRKKPVNGPLLSNLVRYEVLEYLKAHGISAREEDESTEIGPLDGCGMNPLPNNGIELVYRGSCIRLRKGVEVPMPTTDTQRDWYQQELPFDDNGPIAVTNLLILWRSDGQRKFAGLKLLRTKRVLRKSVACDWEVDVSRPSIIPTETIPSEYGKDSELPLLQPDQEATRQDSTGTDDHER